MGCPPWECPDTYVNNSPVFFANMVTTPLLVMHGDKDGAVAFSQGVEFFTALRRCRKKAWLLEYEDQDHTIGNLKAKQDYTIRLKQFLDHYLKNAPAPKWMTRGIPAAMKGIDDGLELDHEIKTPGEGLLTPEEKKKVEALQKRKPITIKLD